MFREQIEQHSGVSAIVLLPAWLGVANLGWVRFACKSLPIIRISASFDPSAVRVGDRTVYTGRREADVGMTSWVTDYSGALPAGPGPPACID
jgi:hypothetical protein